MSQAVKMKKNNRVLYVEKGRAASFLQQGYDQIDEEGDIIKHATGGRSVSLAEYNKIIDQNDRLETENKLLKAEVKKLQADLKKAETKK